MQVYSIPAQSWRCHMLLGGVRAPGRPGLINLLLWGPVIAFMAECWRDWFSDQSCVCVWANKTTVSDAHTHSLRYRWIDAYCEFGVMEHYWDMTRSSLSPSLFPSFVARHLSISNISLFHLFSWHNSSFIFHHILCITHNAKALSSALSLHRSLSSLHCDDVLMQDASANFI